jgi:hypothetical protein
MKDSPQQCHLIDLYWPLVADVDALTEELTESNV